MHELQNTLARFAVLVAVALQYLFAFKRIFDRNERRIWFIGIPKKENKAFFTGKFLVVVHTPYAVVENVALMDKLVRTFGNDNDERLIIPL
jgi:hypothetical protein